MSVTSRGLTLQEGSGIQAKREVREPLTGPPPTLPDCHLPQTAEAAGADWGPTALSDVTSALHTGDCGGHVWEITCADVPGLWVTEVRGHSYRHLNETAPAPPLSSASSLSLQPLPGLLPPPPQICESPGRGPQGHIRPCITGVASQEKQV